MLEDPWQSVMDPDKNALKGLPKSVKFQLMTTLAFIWSTIFCVNAGLLAWLPGYVFAHIALISIGLFGTAWLFRPTNAVNLEAERSSPVPVADRNPDRA